MMHVLPPISELWCINPNSLTLHMVDGKGGGGGGGGGGGVAGGGVGGGGATSL